MTRQKKKLDNEVNGVLDVQIDKKEKTAAKSPAKIWFNLFLRVFVAIVLFFFAIFFTWYAVFLSSHNYYSVKGASMVPTLNEEIPESKFNNASGISYDCVYVDKTHDAKIFDIIVINTHQTIIENGNQTTKTLIKRLMAMEGDYISIAKTVNEKGEERLSFFRVPNEALPEEANEDDLKNFVILDQKWELQEKGENGYEIYNPDSIWTHKSQYSSFVTSTLDVEIEGVEFDAEREYELNFFSTYLKNLTKEKFDCGDYKVSKDGLVYVRVPKGMFFYMGDNRAFSSDAREDGFRKFEDIVGPVEIVIFNNGLFARIGTFFNYFFKEVEKFFARY